MTKTKNPRETRSGIQILNPSKSEPSKSEADKSDKSLNNITNFVKTLAKNAPTLALTAAVVPDIMDFMKGLTDPFYETGEALQELGLTASEGFEEMAADIATSIYGLQPIAENLGTWIGDTYDKVQEKDWEGLSGNIESGLTSAWDGVVDFFADDQLMTDIGEGAAAVINGVVDALKTVTAEDFFAVGSGIITALSSALTNIDWGDVFELWVQSWVTTFNIGKAILDWIVESIQDAFSSDDFDDLSDALSGVQI